MGVLKIVLVNMVAVLMMSAKLTNLGLLKIKVFSNKPYDLIVFVHDVINQILSCESNYLADVVIRAEFENSNMSMREVIIISIFWGFDHNGSSSII